MNTTTLNMTTLDGGIIIKRGEGGGGVTINNQDKVVDITENGTTEVVADGGYTGLGKVTINTEVSGGGGSKPKWTGHADAEGLKAIGWTDEDIAYYQENGVNWNEEDDQYHLVSDDNKALYGVLTASNIGLYRNRIVYLPKIDTSNVTTMNQMFYECYALKAIPQLDTSKVTNMSSMFGYCYSLSSIPQLDTSKVTNMYEMFYDCYALKAIPQLDTSKVTNMNKMFCDCYALKAIPQLDTSKVTNMSSMFNACTSLSSIPQLNTSNVQDMSKMFYFCTSLSSIPQLDTSKVTSIGNMFYYCYPLTHVNLKNVKLAYQLNNAALLSKDSLLYLINNEAATAAITIKLATYAYDRWATDPDIVAALANHPNISISK
jgi:surface protein